MTSTSADDGNSLSVMIEPPELSVVEPLCKVTTDASLDPPNLTPMTLPVVIPREVDSTLGYSGELITDSVSLPVVTPHSSDSPHSDELNADPGSLLVVTLHYYMKSQTVNLQYKDRIWMITPQTCPQKLDHT